MPYSGDIETDEVSLQSFLKFGKYLPGQRGCYIRAMTAGVQLRKKILALSLKGLGAKTN
jgi:hypothetical protein